MGGLNRYVVGIARRNGGNSGDSEKGPGIHKTIKCRTSHSSRRWGQAVMFIVKALGRRGEFERSAPKIYDGKNGNKKSIFEKL